jgi:hypothetical protein
MASKYITMTIGTWARGSPALVRAQLPGVAVSAKPEGIVWSRAGKRAVLERELSCLEVWWLTDIRRKYRRSGRYAGM